MKNHPYSFVVSDIDNTHFMTVEKSHCFWEKVLRWFCRFKAVGSFFQAVWLIVPRTDLGIFVEVTIGMMKEETYYFKGCTAITGFDGLMNTKSERNTVKYLQHYAKELLAEKILTSMILS